MAAFYVYALFRPDGTPFYIGKGTGNRMFRHEADARGGHQCHKCNIIRKIWREGGEIKPVVMFTTDSEAEAHAYEMELIAQYGRGTLSNLTDGGEGTTGYRLSDQHKAAISAAQKQITGRHLRPETKEKLRAIHTGRDYPQTWRDKVRDALKGILRPERRGENHPNASLTQAQANEIRRLYAEGGITQKQLAARFNTAQSIVGRIIVGKTFTDTPNLDEQVQHARDIAQSWNSNPRPNHRGARNPSAALTQKQADDIRTLYASGAYTQNELAKQFGVARNTIGAIIANRTYIDNQGD